MTGRNRSVGILPSIFAASVDLGDLVDIEDVEVCQTGIEYPLSSGPRTFTTEDLADAVAAQDDSAVKVPRTKLGHQANLGLMEDGQPAIGTVTDMRLEQGGHLVMGTLKGVPEWLAKVLPSAYPARSIEGAVGVETVTGHNWRLVITDLALLGVVWPGVTTLEDIQALYSKDGPDNVQVLTTKEEVAALSVVAAAVVNAQVNVDNVLRAYRENKSQDQFWWWVRSMMIDPNELIVEDEDNGELYRVPYEVKGEEVSFSDPIAVKIQYVDKPKPKEDKQAASIAAAAAIGGWRSAHPQAKQLANFTSREESMTVKTALDPVALRNALGLEDDATDEQVQQALAAAGFVTPPGTPGTGDEAPASEQPGTQAHGGEGQPDNQAPGNAGNDPATGRPDTQPVTDSNGQTQIQMASDGTVRLDADTYQRLLHGAQAGLRAEGRQQSDDRNRIIDAAIREGRIAPSRRDHWLAKFNADEQEATTLLTASADQGGLAPGLVPVAQVGQEQPLEDTTIEAYPAEWLPEIQRSDQR